MARTKIRFFIGPPFRQCPSCTNSTYGVVLYWARSVLRQCETCGWEEHHHLPAISKQILYLDQFLVSEYAKIQMEGPQGWTKLHDHQRKALVTVARLRACQAAVCPVSHYHRQESIRDGRHKEFKQAYVALSGDAEWAFSTDIEAAQAYRHAAGWIAGRPIDWSFPRDEALAKQGDGWESAFSLTVDMGDHAERRAEAEQVAASTTSDLAAIAERWRRGPTTFEAVFREEAQQVCHSHMKHAGIAAQRFKEAIARGDPTAPLLDPSGSRSGIWLHAVWRAFREAGVPEANLRETTLRYANEADFTTLPYLRISASLWAAWAMQVHHGANPPDSGTCNDIGIIGSFMPYCDAMFIDRPQHARLKELPRGHLSHRTKVFSYANVDEFVSWGRSIEAAMPSVQRDALREHYGVDPDRVPWS